MSESRRVVLDFQSMSGILQGARTNTEDQGAEKSSCFVEKRAFGAGLKFSEMESERAHHTSTGHQIILPVTEFAFGHRVAAIAQIGGVYTQVPLRGAIARAQADGGKAARRRGVALVQKPRSGVIHIDAAQKPALRRVEDAKRREIVGGHFQPLARKLRGHSAEILHEISKARVVVAVGCFG